MKKVFLIISLIFILFICAFNYKQIYYRIYPFDRITGEFEITLNGKRINMIDEYYVYENSGKIRLENDTETFKIKGGKYGIYKIGFIIDNDILYDQTNDLFFKDSGDIDLKVCYYNTNWWNISNINIKIDLINDNGTWYAYYDISLKEKQKTATENIRKKVVLSEIDDNEIIIGV